MDGYVLGYSAREARRLEVQANLLEDTLHQGLVRAGLRLGMRVLDIGSGIGDVSFLASKIVGPSGSVHGVDVGAESVSYAQGRAQVMGLTNVTFHVSDLYNYQTNLQFDAIVGRFILLFLPDPAALLRRLTALLKPGGVVVFQEMDSSAAMQDPPSHLFQKVNDWVFGSIAAAGAERDMGGKMARVFLDAGLPRPSMIGLAPVESGPDSPYYEFLSDMTRSLLPAIEKFGLATAAEIDIETLADRLRSDALEHERTIYPPRIVTAWSQLRSE